MWEAGKSKFKVLAGSVSGEILLICSERTTVLLCPQVTKRELTSCLALAPPFFFFNKGTNPIHEGFTLMTLPPKGPISEDHHIGMRVLTYEFGGHKCSVHNKLNKYLLLSLPGADTQH